MVFANVTQDIMAWIVATSLVQAQFVDMTRITTSTVHIAVMMRLMVERCHADSETMSSCSSLAKLREFVMGLEPVSVPLHTLVKIAQF